MNGPKYFPDEIAARLRELNPGDKVVIKTGCNEKHFILRQSARYEDGLVSSWRRFETLNGLTVCDIETRLYDAAESGADLYVITNNNTEPF